jgi:hypothetical protein
MPPVAVLFALPELEWRFNSDVVRADIHDIEGIAIPALASSRSMISRSPPPPPFTVDRQPDCKTARDEAVTMRRKPKGTNISLTTAFQAIHM